MNNAANLKGFRLRQSFERSRTSPRPGAADGREDMRVGIIGIGMTAFRPSTPEYNLQELMLEAASRAYADAAINPREDVDSFITCAEDYYEGFGIFDEFVPDQLGAALRPTCTVSGDGLQGLANAYMQIRTGLIDVAVVEAHSKASDVVTLDGIIEHALDPIWNKPLGAHPFVVAGLEEIGRASGRERGRVSWGGVVMREK